jgi:hypothetical protein
VTDQDLAIAQVRALLSELCDIVEKQQVIIKTLVAKQRRLDERLDLELLHLQPAPDESSE